MLLRQCTRRPRTPGTPGLPRLHRPLHRERCRGLGRVCLGCRGLGRVLPELHLTQLRDRRRGRSLRMGRCTPWRYGPARLLIMLPIALMNLVDVGG